MRLALILLTLGACTGEINMDDASGSGGGEGQQAFASTVAPLLRAQCASCHEGSSPGAPFLGVAGVDDDYTALLADSRLLGGFQPSSALLLTKGSHAGVGWWTSAQRTAIESWMKIEASSTGPGGGDILAAWASCMTLENWDDARMGSWANKQTEQGQTCGGCHADGEHGFHANPVNDVMFAQQRTQLGIGSFFQVQATGGTPTVVTAAAKIRNKCSGANLHPQCAVDDQYVEYLERFHALTSAMLKAGLCGEPGYKSLTDPL